MGWFRKRTLRRLETPNLVSMLEKCRARAVDWSDYAAKHGSETALGSAANAEDFARDIVQVLSERSDPRL